MHYWTGFYTSRPNLKRLIRSYSALTKASVTLYSIGALKSGVVENQLMIKQLQETQSMLMHHDTITGTSPARII